MSTALREQGVVTIHDQVVSLVAQRWAKSFHCKVTIHTVLSNPPGLILANSAISSGGR